MDFNIVLKDVCTNEEKTVEFSPYVDPEDAIQESGIEIRARIYKIVDMPQDYFSNMPYLEDYLNKLKNGSALLDSQDIIEEIGEIVYAYGDLDEDKRLIVDAYLSENYLTYDSRFRGDEGRVWHGCRSMTDVAERYVEETDLLRDCDEKLREFFDYKAYGEHLAKTGYFVKYPNDYVELYN